MKQKLTEALLAAMVPSGRDQFIFDTLLSGYYVRMTPAAVKILMNQTAVGGKKIRTKIGRHPDISVARGRDLAHEIQADLRKGLDPVAERRVRQRAVAADATTVAELAARWLIDHGRTLKPRSLADYRQLLDDHVLPELGRMAVKAVEQEDVVRLHLKMKLTPRRANYAAVVFRALMNFAEDLRLRPPGTNPCKGFKFYREKKHERFLSEIEYGRAAEAIAEAECTGVIGPHAAGGLRLALLTGARSGEITAAQWKHVDWTRRVIRLPDSKGNEPRTIHLSAQAVEVLQSLPRVEPFIIAGRIAGRPFTNLGRSWITARALRGLDNVRLHDLRHSYASLAVKRGASLPQIGELLGHKVTATTQRYAHLDTDVVAGINDGIGGAITAAGGHAAPAAANVLKLRRRKRSDV